MVTIVTAIASSRLYCGPYFANPIFDFHKQQPVAQGTCRLPPNLKDQRGIEAVAADFEGRFYRTNAGPHSGLAECVDHRREGKMAFSLCEFLHRTVWRSKCRKMGGSYADSIYKQLSRLRSRKRRDERYRILDMRRGLIRFV